MNGSIAELNYKHEITKIHSCFELYDDGSVFLSIDNQSTSLSSKQRKELIEFLNKYKNKDETQNENQ